MAGSGQKTEKPTPRRLQKAREQGQFPSSKQFVSGLQFISFLALLGWFAGQCFENLRASMHDFLAEAFTSELSPEWITHHLRGLVYSNAGLLAGFGGILLISSLATQMFITQFGFSTAKLAPDFSRLNPMSRLQQLPGQNFPAFVQAAVLLPVFLGTCWFIVTSHLNEFLALPLLTVEAGAQRVVSALDSLLWKAAFGFFIFGCIDLYRELHKYQGQLKMTKQDIRDEHKEVEGNPQVKQRIRKLQRDAARRNMMKELPNATAVIVNPTHYAVAIRYQMESMAAPTVIAKGKNYLALRIKDKALEHKIPIVENVPLAQALYKSVDVGQEIPAHLYRAVAEILAYIFRLTNGRMTGRS